jgi:5-methylthioadenosine/S-adenosylhomocysteine deaminase
MTALLIRNASFLITVDADRRIIKDGAIGIANDRIEFVGRSSDVPSTFASARVIDASGLVAAPGFVDTHVHNTQQLGRGLGDECDVSRNLVERLFPYESSLDADDAYWAARHCQMELLKAGTTCFLDPSSYFPDETARAVAEIGIRGVVSRTAFDVQRTAIGDLPQKAFRETLEEAVERSEQTVIKHNHTCNGRVRAWFALRMLAGCSDDLCQRIRALATKHKVGIIMHICESREETVVARVNYGMSDVERLAKLNVLGPDLVMIHMGWINPKEIALVREHGVKISFTPATGHRLGMGDTSYGHFPEMAAIGICISMSCNAAMSSNFLDMVRLMGLGAGAMRSTRLNPHIFPAEQMLEMATINGAIAVGMADEIGSIEVGKKADISLFDTRKPEWRPLLNPISNLVHSSRGGAHTVIVDGEPVVVDGRMLKINEEETLDECQRRGQSVAVRSGLGRITQSPWPQC